LLGHLFIGPEETRMKLKRKSFKLTHILLSIQKENFYVVQRWLK